MSSKKTSLTSDITVSFEGPDSENSELEVALSLETVEVENQACDEVFFDLFVTKNKPVTMEATGGSISGAGSHDHDFDDYLSFNEEKSSRQKILTLNENPNHYVQQPSASCLTQILKRSLLVRKFMCSLC